MAQTVMLWSACHVSVQNMPRCQPDSDTDLASEWSSGKQSEWGRIGTILKDLANGNHELVVSIRPVQRRIGCCLAHLEDPAFRAWAVVQGLMKRKLVRNHDDQTGLVTTILEMCFVGNCGSSTVAWPAAERSSIEHVLFAELGLVLECADNVAGAVLSRFEAVNVPCYRLGHSSVEQTCEIKGYMPATSMTDLRDRWESTSFALEMLQCNPTCVDQERLSMQSRMAPPLALSYEVALTQPELIAEHQETPRQLSLR